MKRKFKTKYEEIPFFLALDEWFKEDKLNQDREILNKYMIIKLKIDAKVENEICRKIYIDSFNLLSNFYFQIFINCTCENGSDANCCIFQEMTMIPRFKKNQRKNIKSDHIP